MKQVLIDNRGRLFGKYDLFLPLFLLIAITLAYFIGKVLLQKDEYITAELVASGGDWWWDTPNPPYWLTDPIQPGATELDDQGNVLVEVLDVHTFEEAERKMMWLKVKLKVSPANKAQQYQFRREPIQVGSLVYVAPNNVKIFANVMAVNEDEKARPTQQRIITIREYDVYPWQVDPIKAGEQLKASDGSVIAEVLEKRVTNAEMVTVDDRGNTHVRSNPLKRDLTVRLRLTTTESHGREYFSYFQPIKRGFFVWIPFESINVSGTITSLE